MQFRFMGYGSFGLICVWSFVNFSIHNIAWFRFEDIAFISGALVSVILIGWVALFFIERFVPSPQMSRWFLASTAMAFLFFHYPEILNHFTNLFRWAKINIAPHYGYAALFLALPITLLLAANRPVLVRVTFYFTLTVTSASLIEIVWIQTQSPASEPQQVTSVSPQPIKQKVRVGTQSTNGTSNIYHIITDAYARADQLKKILGFDNSKFIDALEGRGFRIANKAMANYPQTLLSIPSMLNMSYPYTEKDTFKNYIALMNTLSGKNASREGLWGRGYTLGLGSSGIWTPSSCLDNSRVFCLPTKKRIIGTRFLEIASAINRMTPISYFVSIIESVGNVTTITDVQAKIDALDLPKPVAIVVHTLPPHEPYLSKADCSKQSAIQFQLSGGLNREKYLEALQCVNKRLLAFSDYLMEKDPNAIVVYHSDHGTQFLTDWPSRIDAWTKDQFDERFGIFLAVRAPKHCQDRLPANLSLVNLYRFIFSCIDGNEPNYLPNQHFITTSTDFTDFGKLYRFPVNVN